MTVGVSPPVRPLEDPGVGLAELRVKIEALAHRVEALERRLPRPRDEEAILGPLLAATFGEFRSGVFSTVDLMEAAAESPSLRHAVVAVTGRDRPSGAVRRLGQYLGRHRGCEAGGFRLRSLDYRARDGQVYGVESVTTKDT